MRTAILLAALWATAAVAQDEVQTWVDEAGEVHYTNDPSQVPARYRRTMKRTAGDGALSIIPASQGEAKKSTGTEATGEEAKRSTLHGGGAVTVTRGSPSPSDETYWRSRFREARHRISQLEDQLREQKTLSAQIGPTRAQASDGSLGDPRIDQIKRRIAEISRDLDEARSELRSLNEAAADANVPQSWR